MTILGDIYRDTRRAILTGRSIKAEDNKRVLAPDALKGYRLPLVYGNNDYLLSKTAAWVGFHIPNKPWGFLDENARRSYFYATMGVFSNIFPAEKDNAGHLIVTNHVYTADEWQDSLMARYADTASASFGRYIKESRKVIEQREFFERECYLFARVGSRGNQGGIRGYIREWVETFALGAGIEDSQPDKEEREFWSDQALSLVDSLSTSWLQATPIHRRRVEWLVRHFDTPGLPTPDVSPADDVQWGAGHWRTVLASSTQQVPLGKVGKQNLRCLELDAPTGEGKSYAAYLALTHVPNELHFERNWAHHASSLMFPVDVNIRFEIIDPDRAEKELQRPITDAEAQEEEDRESGARTDDTTQFQQQGLRQVKSDVQIGRSPLAYWQAIFSVSDTSKEELKAKVVKLIKHYKDIQFTLAVPHNDQRELFYQSFPGSEMLVGSWVHRTDTKYLSSAQPWLTSSVGDRENAHGLYQGHTIVRDANGTPQKGVPVFYDLQNVVDDEGKAPTEVVCGFPGSGKTVSRGLKCVHEDALRGITQFVYDPKGDFLPLKRWAKQMQLDDKKVKVVDLYDPNVSVSLEPFGVAEIDLEKGIDERESLTIEVLEALCPDFVSDQNRGLEYRQVISRAVGTTLAAEEVYFEDDADGVSRRLTRNTATMERVMEVLRAWRRGDFTKTDIGKEQHAAWVHMANMLDDHLTSISKDTLGRLLFKDSSAAGGTGSITVNEGDMVIFVALNMTTTEPGERPNRSSTIADVISGVMTDFIRSLLFRLPDEVVKSATFDEWHVIKRTPRAPALLDWLRRMGRSKRCMVRQMSQSATDFEKGSLSTVWCGYMQNEAESIAACDLLGIEPSLSNVKMLQSLQAGQFLFRDVHGRVAQVQVDIWDDWLLGKFNTQAKDKERLIAEVGVTGEL